MKNASAITRTVPIAKTHMGYLDSLCRSALLSKLRGIENGELILEHGGERHLFGRPSDSFPRPIHLVVNRPDFFSQVALEGSVGAGESYMNGDWTCSDLPGLVRLFVRNRETLERLDSGLASLTKPLLKLYHSARKNTRSGSRRNIAAHYDLGNDFYRLFLDDTLTYSSAIFERDDMPLEQASRAKLDRVCRKLRLTPGDHLLEIGTGWGSFALHAASHYGCRVTTTTISQKQFEVARERVAQAGLKDRITLLLEDYRDLRGTYSRIASIEMIEAVGWQFYDTFFRKCSELLTPDGMLALQAITIQDQLYDQARRSVDFIQRFVFPGGCLPSVTALCDSTSRAGDLKLYHLEDFTPHYARTLREWRLRFLQNLDSVRALGYPDSFIRMWEFYLAYCEGGFEERNIGVAHLVFTKPLCRVDPLLGAL